MRKLLLACCLMLSTFHLFANRIDELKTDSDVVRFLIPLSTSFTSKYAPQPIIQPIDTILKYLKKNDCFSLANTWGAKSWQKVDLNNDGLTDLIVICTRYSYSNFVVLDNGNNTFKLIQLQYSSFSDELINAIQYKGKNLLVFHSIEEERIDKRPNFYRMQYPRTDTLVYKFDHFIELNEHPVKYDIDSVIFHAGVCYGPCPIFYTKLNSKGKIRFEKDKPVNVKLYFVKDPWGKPPKTAKAIIPKTYVVAKAKLTTGETNEIFDLINYIDFKHLKNKYAVSWTDDVHGWIRVKYKDGSFKEIEDYGERGTFGLSTLFSKFYAIAAANKVN
ncbi:DUF6438 domain-containing protein [Mucilaginibacter sp. dw_454]|uniref:DUF6438 domain-containing protein n=1 Tax=Mucilaginibacter sp. dw_454 TaxID=2720079 RepID=UPI001BD4CE8E|nr:DUF6438 domain-containing protein [Mucilaginibacter sp. dw_454]